MGEALAGRAIVVTGAARGLGLAIAERLARDGACLWLADIDAEGGERAAAMLRDRGAEATFDAVDVADEQSVAAFAEAVAGRGPLYGLVNNAALADAVGGKLFYELDPAEWDRIMAVNARGPWLVARALAPALIAAGNGRIVNIASDAALYGSPRLSHYIASKGAVIAFTRAIARELGEHGITVNAVAPGITETESTVRVPAERHRLYRDNRAIKRPQHPEDTAGLVAYLMSADAAYMTGQLLVVDGGFVLH
jgi:NAD(P)-dependent dehydrogenase (short-subunit alcohol dehydrogenase family)